MVDYAGKCDAIVNALKAKAANLGGMSADSIEEGRTGEPGAPPFLYVYLTPGRIENAVQGPYKFWTDITVLVGVPGTASASQSIRDGMHLAGQCLKVLDDIPDEIWTKEISLQEQTADRTILRLIMESPFEMFQALDIVAPPDSPVEGGGGDTD